MAELKTYKERVRSILELHENARNNDGSLYACYLNKYHHGLVQKDSADYPVIRLTDFRHFPPMENIRRSRQLIQNGDNEYLPTDPKVRKARRIKEENWTNCEVREAKNA